MDCNETTRILNSETNEQLLKTHAEELANVRKLRLVVKELKQIDCSKLQLPDNEQVKKVIVLIKIGEYLYLNEKKDQVLNLGGVTSNKLNYTERKAVRHQLTANLIKELQRINNFSSKLRTELPELLSDGNTLHTEILHLEKQRRSNLESMIQLRNRKCNFLKVVAELKMGPYLACELEVMFANARHNQTKVNILRGYFVNELLTRTEHNLKAIREVEGYINDAMEKDQEISN
ncbi:augmin complex subunit dgt2 [Lucilia cuprina]|uniref:augmin complex subunit dgt2 n=1 Tax=Lucilia cuprina TaxID=7375 RepID=UPI001F068DE0|nr:augmin complex subunit dgt2 [Lucilia cuprina]XP_046800989.1 augmin complex subunit dgt2 [Lucilia cuprina]